MATHTRAVVPAMWCSSIAACTAAHPATIERELAFLRKDRTQVAQLCLLFTQRGCLLLNKGGKGIELTTHARVLEPPLGTVCFTPCKLLASIVKSGKRRLERFTLRRDVGMQPSFKLRALLTFCM